MRHVHIKTVLSAEVRRVVITEYHVLFNEFQFFNLL